MKPTVAAIVGPPGSGTATLAARVGSILNWPVASFGSYVRGEAARRGLPGTRKDLQDLGEEIERNDPEMFCRAVIAQSRWRPGLSLVVDGLRHERILQIMRRLLSPVEVTEIYVPSDESTREFRLRERGEVPQGGILAIDHHPVEHEALTVLPRNAQITINGSLPEPQQIDQLVEYLIHLAQIPPLTTWVTSENLVRIPTDIRDKLDLHQGDRIEFGLFENFLVACRVLDEDRMRSVFGRLRNELAGIDPADWLNSIRGRTMELGDRNESSD